MPDYNIDAMNAVMRRAQDLTSKFGTLADGFPSGATSPAAFGTLDASAAVAGALDVVNKLVHDELGAAESKLDQVAHALDAIVRSVSDTEHHNKTTMTVQV